MAVLTRTCRSWPTLAKPTLASVSVLVVWPDFWPKPTLAKPILAKTDFGQNRTLAKTDFGQTEFGQIEFDLLCVVCCVWCGVLWLCVCVWSVCGVVWVLVSRFHGVGFHVWCWFQGFGLVMFGAPATALSPDRPSTALPRTALPRTALPRTALPLDRPKFWFFFPLPPQNSFFSSLSSGLLVEFWWCFLKARGPSNVHVWALWLLCETPEALGPPGLRTRTRELQTCTLERPGLQNTTKIPREDTQRGKKKEFLSGRGEKKREILGPPPFGPPPFGPPPFGPPPFLGLGPWPAPLHEKKREEKIEQRISKKQPNN